jgi:hypothetical protein
LERSDLADVSPFGFGNEAAALSNTSTHVTPPPFVRQGTWAPRGVNPMMRFSRYEAGGHFQWHRDGAFVLHDERRSAYTIHIALNVAYEGASWWPPFL